MEKNEDIGLFYLQLFGTPGGCVVLSDLISNFDNTSSYGKKPEYILAESYRRDVITHIKDKMRSVDIRAAAKVIFEAEIL